MDEIRQYNNSPVLTVPDLAEALRIGRNAAYKLVQSQAIRSIRIGNQIRIPREALEEFLRHAVV